MNNNSYSGPLRLPVNCSLFVKTACVILIHRTSLPFFHPVILVLSHLHLSIIVIVARSLPLPSRFPHFAHVFRPSAHVLCLVLVHYALAPVGEIILPESAHHSINERVGPSPALMSNYGGLPMQQTLMEHSVTSDTLPLKFSKPVSDSS